MKFIKSLLIGIFLGLILLVAIAIAVSLIFEKQVTSYIIAELNERIEVKIDIDDSNLSILRKFPNASIEFVNVTAYSPSTFPKKICGINTDTLFSTNKLFLEFNILDLLTQNFTIKNIHFDCGTINIFIDQNGNENYRFWKSDNTNESSFKIDLKKVKFSQTNTRFCDEKNSIRFFSNIEKMNISGLLLTNNYNLQVDALMEIGLLSVADDIYIENKTSSIDFLFSIHNNIFTFSKGFIELGRFKTDITGEINYNESLLLDLKIVAQNQAIEELITIIPKNIINEIDPIKFNSGLITVFSAFKGEFSKTKHPSISGTFQIKKASFSNADNRIKVKQIFTDGVFSNGKEKNILTSIVELNSFSATLDKSSIAGNLIVSNLSDPLLLVNYSANLDFKEIHNTFDIDTLEILEGSGKIKGTFAGKVNEIKTLRFTYFFKKDFAFNLKIKDGLFKLKDNPLIVKNINGLVAINETLYTDSLYFRILDNDILLNGEASNLYQYFTGEGTSSVLAELTSESIDLNQLAPMFLSDKVVKDSPSYRFPERLNIHLNLQINQFSVGKFIASQIKGSLNYKPKMFSLHEISFQSMNGYNKIGGVIVQDYKNDFVVKFQSTFKNIKIDKLFYSFNNFGQTFLPEKNISGNLSGNLYFSALINDKLEINKKSVSSESNLIIQDGALINFEPMKSLSRFIDVKELENIKFSTLQNQINIKDEKVTIPKMDIKSSAFNITLNGTHRFDNFFEYHFKILLSDLLASKAKNRATQKNEAEFYEDDGLGKTNVFLKITGTPNDYRINYDYKQARESRKIELQNEKSELKKILNEEFGWFKEDSTATIDTLHNNKTKSFKIDWEENPVAIDKKVEDNKVNNNQQFQIIFDEDSVLTN
ncbi:MAG: AsmA-like C-terminal region-containing protein [Bacteroidales bacterium]